MRRIQIAFSGCLIAIAASLLLARVHPFGDAGLYAASGEDTPILAHAHVLPQVRTILEQKCADCHSNRSSAPLYARFAPVSWLLERDILKGRKAMNLSQWETYPADWQQIMAAKIVEDAKLHKMPLFQYRMIHWGAQITDADVGVFTQWTRGMQGHEGSDGTQLAVSGDPVRGKAVFTRRCTGCHAMTEDREGPRLQGVYGRISGEVAGFVYSPALKKAHIVWNSSTLEQWLTDPDTVVPGNNMEFPVAKPQDRSDLISFLQQSSENSQLSAEK
jgi:cytochrome c